MSNLNRRSFTALVLLRLSKSCLLSIKDTGIFEEFNISDKAPVQYTKVSTQSAQASDSAARADLTTRLIRFDFHSIGQQLFSSSAKNTMCPPWLPAFGKLLKLASEKLTNLIDLRLSFGKRTMHLLF